MILTMTQVMILTITILFVHKNNSLKRHNFWEFNSKNIAEYNAIAASLKKGTYT